MPSANVAANAALVIGLLSPLFMALMPNYKWLFGFLLTVGGLFAASLGIIGAAVDAEAAKPNESLDAQLGYAINFWEVVTAASLVAVSTAVSSEAKMRLLIIAFLLSFTPPAAQADDLLNPPQPALARIQAHLDHCKDTQPGNINEMLCAIEADRAVDTLLNALYGKIVAKLKKAEDLEHDIEDRKELLRRLVPSERAWIACREAECSHASAAMLGGSGENAILANCRLSTRQGRVTPSFDFIWTDFPTSQANSGLAKASAGKVVRI
jgi:uncharacterized protein YecT (DUF1311 family)